MTHYSLPTLLDLTLYRLSYSSIPPLDLLPLPPHLKDALLHLLVKRGSLSAPHLASLLHPKVTQVDLSDCLVTPDHLQALTSCSKLTKLNLNQSRPSSSHDPSLDSQNMLTSLLSSSEKMLSSLLSSCSHLRVLYLRNCQYLTDKVLSRFPPTSPLTHLDLGGCTHLGDSGVISLATSCPHLTSVSLARTGVTDQGLRVLSRSACKVRLLELKIDGCRAVTDEGIEYLVEGENCLQILIFHGCPLVTDRSRVALHGLLGRVGAGVKQVTWTVY